MDTSKKCAIVISFNSSSVLSLNLLFSFERSRNIEKSLFNFNLEVPISCSEKTTVIGYDSEMISSRLEVPNEVISKDISVDKLEELSNIISAGKCDKDNINYSGKSANIVQNSNSTSFLRPGLLEKATQNSKLAKVT